MEDKLIPVIEYIQQVIIKLNNIDNPLWQDYCVFAAPVLEDLVSKIQTYMVNEEKDRFFNNLQIVKDKLHILDLMYSELPYYNTSNPNDLHTYLFHFTLAVISYIEELVEENNSHKEEENDHQ